MKYDEKIFNLFTTYCKNNHKIEIYDDYKDHEYPEQFLYEYRKKENGERYKAKITNKDDFINNIITAYDDCVFDYFNDFIDDFVSSISSQQLKSYFNNHKDDLYNDLLDIIYDYVDIEYPINNFLNDEIKVNIFWLTNKNQSGYDRVFLKHLLHKQGYKVKNHQYLRKLLNCLHVYHNQKITKKDKQQYNKDYKNDPFLKSLIDEIENCYLDSPFDFCFIAKISINTYFDILEGKIKKIKIDKNCMCGLVDYYNGGGSILEINLKKDMVINTSDIQLLVEGIDRYTVDDIYGLCGSCFGNYVEVL